MKTKSRTALISAFTVCLVLMFVVTTCYAYQDSGSVTLYAHSESTTIDAIPYKSLKATACDGPSAVLTYEGIDSGAVTLGNSSAIVLSGINSTIKTLKATTWTFTYYAVANVTQKTRFLVSIYIVNSTGDAMEEHAFKASTGLLTATNASYTGTYSFVSAYALQTTDYLKIDWYLNKTDTTALKVQLWLDVAATPTKIAGIEYDLVPTGYSDIRTILPYFYIALGLIGLVPLVITVIAFVKMDIDAKIAVSIILTDIIFILAILVILTFITALS